MSTTWFTSDLHLGHRRIVELSHRPFTTIEEHDHAIAHNWAETVQADDIVWVLGDISVESGFRHALGILAGLPGRKRLVTGNHDMVWVGKSDAWRYLPEFQAVFEIITPWARAKVGQTKVLLSHFPYTGDHTEEDRYPQYRLPLGPTPLLHGHTHSPDRLGPINLPLQVHVGVDAWDFRPVASHELEKFLPEERT